MEELIKNEMLRLMGCISSMDPIDKPDAYCNLVHCVDLFIYMEQRAMAMRGEFEDIKVGETVQFKGFKMKSAEVEETAKEEPVEIEPLMEEEPPMATPEELTMEYVRGKLSEASQNGIQIRTVIQKFVPEGKDIKFSNVPKDKYEELVEELNHAE